MVSKLRFLSSIPYWARTIMSYLPLWAILATLGSSMMGLSLSRTWFRGSWVPKRCPTGT